MEAGAQDPGSHWMGIKIAARAVPADSSRDANSVHSCKLHKQTFNLSNLSPPMLARKAAYGGTKRPSLRATPTSFLNAATAAGSVESLKGIHECL